jgi:hypothetical protein
MERSSEEYLSRNETYVYLKCPMCSHRIHSSVTRPLAPICHTCRTSYEIEVNGGKINVLELIKAVHVRMLRDGKLKRHVYRRDNDPRRSGRNNRDTDKKRNGKDGKRERL